MKVTSKVIDVERLKVLAPEALSPYGGNVYVVAQRIGPTRFSFTLETHDAWAKGSRTSTSGRHMRKASWEAHRDILAAIFATDPEATVLSALATYRGKADFERNFESTGSKNVGSQMEPCTMRECSV